MTTLGEFSVSTARPLPVIVLADASGSMSQHDKIAALNEAVREMIASFAEMDEARVEIHVAVIAFGGRGARLHLPLQPAHLARWEPLEAEGKTPMGQAITLATSLLEDRALLPRRAYCPTIVLVSDGIPTDEWREPLEALKVASRGGKAHRVAMAIGVDAQAQVLESFVDGAGDRNFIYRAADARDIRRFFRWVTLSTQQQSRGPNPNQPSGWEPALAIEELDF
jgi:uncharacterized protein YegL